jgi:hypothetical protein
VFLFRRLPFAIALAAWRVWRRLPAEQRRQLIRIARTHGPRLARNAMRARTRRRF